MPCPSPALVATGSLFLSLLAATAADDASLPALPAVLEARCLDCHGADERKGGLRLDSVLGALRGGDSGEKAVVPGKSGESYLIALVTSADKDHRMPPKGEPLDEAEVASLRQWIDRAENWTAAAAELERRTTDHWSYQPVKRPPVPDSDFANPIDAFVAAKLAERGLDFNPPAEPATLLRRMSLDLTGLLPTPEEAAAFEQERIQDPQAATSTLAERLLASPHFGERWARHWLDVVRYADSHGFETNHERANAYHYRDWVIRAFNEDKPYDRFVFEQLAGDTLGEDAATGFLVAGPWDRVKGQDPLLREMQRQDELSDLVNTVGTAFLGTTMVCAKCHNHKFDPVTQTDFYAMQAVFEGVQHGERDLRGGDEPGRKARAESLAGEIAALRQDLAALAPPPYLGPTLFIDETDPLRSRRLAEPKGEGKNREGIQRGHLADPGGAGRLPNVSGGAYLWWENAPGRDVLAYRPGVEGAWRIWLSWGSGFLTHTGDARYVLDRDGDPATTEDQTEIAKVDQQKFADGGADVGNKAMWSGFLDVGVHELGPASAILVRGGETGTALSADAIVLQRPEAGGVQPRLRPPVEAARNEEPFAPVAARFVRFTIEASNGGQPCLDELEVWSGERNVALGAKPSSSGDFAGNAKHRLEHLNDGRHGNDRSWISSTPGKGWAMLELAAPETIDRIVWGRDREGKYKDRLATAYRIEVAPAAEGPWTLVASSESRAPFASASADALAYELVGLDPARAAEARAARDRLEALEAERAELLALPKVYAGQFVQPKEPTRRLFRGDPLSPKEPVAPASLAVFAPVLEGFALPADAPEAERRVALAQWIADPANPLTARVAVNRVWHYHFGRGLVATPSDFGAMGFLPTHPELLDWLAAELVEGGWSLKRIHRLILGSRTYRQSSAPRPEALAADAGCELLWRFPPRRLEGEAIRDLVLQVAGTLDRRMFGPGFLLFEPNANYARNWIAKDEFSPADHRRMVYAMQLRMEHDAIFGAFDCPDAGQVMPARSRSTTPIQALNLYNSGFVLAQAERFAERVRAEAKSEDPAALAERAFLLAFGRACEGTEREEAAYLAKEHGLASLCRALLNANEFLFLP
jgi:mono/diheme cytochrome c family protein